MTTTTELIELLKSIEYGASGRAREINIYVDDKYVSSPKFKIYGTSDGIVGAELILLIEKTD